MTIELKDALWNIEIKAQGGSDDPLWSDVLLDGSDSGFVPTVRSWYDLTPLESMTLEFQGAGLYSYLIVHSDSRTFEQQIRVLTDRVVEAEVTFDVPDFWTIAELRSGRVLVETSIIELLIAYDIDKIEVIWTP